VKLNRKQLKETLRTVGNAVWSGVSEHLAATNMSQYLCGCLNRYGVPQPWSSRSTGHGIVYGPGSAVFAMLGR
jgi:hypothetical protein